MEKVMEASFDDTVSHIYAIVGESWIGGRAAMLWYQRASRKEKRRYMEVCDEQRG